MVTHSAGSGAAADFVAAFLEALPALGLLLLLPRLLELDGLSGAAVLAGKSRRGFLPGVCALLIFSDRLACQASLGYRLPFR